MIYLENETVTLKVTEENPLYKTLIKFSGESFKVNANLNVEEKVESVAEDKPPSYTRRELDRDMVWEDFNNYFEEYLDPPAMFANILKSHVYSVLDGENGKVVLNEVSPGLYKVNDLYLLYRKN